MDHDKSAVAEWYKGRSIFITGGTGFMGKVLVEKLLFSCKDIANIYILMRSKRGKNPEQRIEEMFKLPMFKRLRDSNPAAIKKLKPVHGDLVSENLGLSEAEQQLIINNASVVFHCAATLKLEAILKDAIEQNTAGTERVVDLVKRIKHLDAFIHMSTAFCSADIDVFEEKVYKCPDDPRAVVDVTKWMKDDALLDVTESLIKPHPNTYTYSKRLAETLVANESDHMKVAIVRPSIVVPALSEPIRGWVDSLNGPMGLLVAAGKGVLRSMHCKGENRAQVVPVDIAINAMILVAYKLGSLPEKPKEVPVYNMTNDGVFKLTWGEVLDIGRSLIYQYPFEMMVWYPDGDIRASYFIHRLYCIFSHWIPAYLIDGLMFIFRQKRFMVRVQTKIQDGLELLQFFATRQWNFSSERFLSLQDNLSPVDQEIFHMDFRKYSVKEYFKYCILGAREFCMKEDPKTLPRCRRQQTFMYILDRALALAFYLGLIWMVISNFETAKDVFDYAGNCVQDIPVLGKLVAN
ncbi:PREDICTED: putative fatty acyl-CoA reductase CG5065 isoform X2 [Nicrophorus vespilloides]|nr:PREDICTED: putative fatty acyl-CoA reductase CG5065 isoform X2 [Nicrophorus vespilloides]XP_017780107.1 PREDICTED: putative fatty acyl-CoA reductase CG5065 isoform X2 [Nicrophorus vespilloides]XP_017780108.1 PREDICTED: putative fatty acyl-CoA reductase CG5065 isoform X2 [Nicrophorus vespilloides]